MARDADAYSNSAASLDRSRSTAEMVIARARKLDIPLYMLGLGRPGEIDRSTLGQPGKYTFCFAEDEAGSPWEPLHVERGFAKSASTVTLFAAEGPRGIIDQLSRTPESLASFGSMVGRSKPNSPNRSMGSVTPTTGHQVTERNELLAGR